MSQIQEASYDPSFTNLVSDMCNKLGLKTRLVHAVAPVLIQNLITLEMKQRDYGQHNLTKFGTFGVVVRMNDKMERITNLLKKKKEAAASVGLTIAHNDPLTDSFLDLANYALIAYVMQQNLWPDETR